MKIFILIFCFIFTKIVLLHRICNQKQHSIVKHLLEWEFTDLSSDGYLICIKKKC